MPPVDSPVIRAFAQWCADTGLVEDETAPHGEAFYAGYRAATQDVIALCARPPEDRPDASVVAPMAGLSEFRDQLHGLHHEIHNYGGSEGERFQTSFEAMLWLAFDYLLPDFDPRYDVTIRRATS